MITKSIESIEEYTKDIFKQVAIAARYGHQQVESINEMTWDELERFNDGLTFLIELENKSGHRHKER